MFENTLTPTCWVNHLMLSTLFKQQFSPDPNTVVNNKLGILSDAVVAPGEYPQIQCIIAGNLGVQSDVIAGITCSTLKPHLPDHAGLYGLIPLLMRLKTDDIPLARRRNYALRTSMTVSGEEYWAYYGRRVDTSDVSIGFRYSETINGEVTEIPWSPTSSALSPTAPEVSALEANRTLSKRIGAFATMDIVLTETDAEELVNVGLILYGTPIPASLTEIAICTGINRTVVIETTTGNANFEELAFTQAAAFVRTRFEPLTSNRKQTISPVLGAYMPLYVDDRVDTAVVTDYTGT